VIWASGSTSPIVAAYGAAAIEPALSPTTTICSAPA
jgi:hypothetical protein